MQEQFGNYTLVERIGIGGMGEVHRAVKRGPDGFEVQVALKRILPHLAREDAFYKRFAREARLAGLLQHPNIVRVNAFDIHEGTPYIEMDYVQGTDLAALLRALPPGERLPLPEAVHIIHQVAKGLAYAHSFQARDGDTGCVFHRDLNPHNILLSSEGEVKIADFGIAKALLSAGTATATVMGKLSYMAPEQVDGKPLDQRCDLFSLGITAYQLLTGIHPFRRASEAATLMALQKAAFRPMAELAPEIPEEIRDLVGSLLCADPSGRPSDAAQVVEVLERHLMPGSAAAMGTRVKNAAAARIPEAPADLLTAPTLSRRAGRRISAIASAAGTLVLLAALAVFFTGGRGLTLRPQPAPEAASTPSAAEPAPPVTREASPGVRLVTVPPQASIYRDGSLLGRSPLSLVFQPGEDSIHLVAELPGFVPAAVTVGRDMAPNEAVVRLQPAPKGTVLISVRPWATILENGEVVGQSHRKFTLPVGTHRLTLANSALKQEKSVTVEVLAGNNRFTFDLEGGD